MAVRVLLADDHRLILAGIRRALEQADGIEVVGEALAGSQVLPLVHRTRPDVVLLDLRFPDMSGLDCLAAIRERHPEVRVVVLSADGDSRSAADALDCGAAAYVVKTVAPVDLAAVLLRVHDGTLDPDARIAGGVAGAGRERFGLTERELSVLRALARGMSNRAIGKEFWVTEQTVKFHVSNVYRKLGVGNRTEAARVAYEHGVLETAA